MERGQIGLEINDGDRFAPGYLVIEREQKGLQVSYAIYDKDYNVVKVEANIGKYSDMVIVTREIMRRNNLDFDHLQRMMDSEMIKSIHKELHEIGSSRNKKKGNDSCHSKKKHSKRAR